MTEDSFCFLSACDRINDDVTHYLNKYCLAEWLSHGFKPILRNLSAFSASRNIFVIHFIHGLNPVKNLITPQTFDALLASDTVPPACKYSTVTYDAGDCEEV